MKRLSQLLFTGHAHVTQQTSVNVAVIIVMMIAHITTRRGGAQMRMFLLLALYTT